MRDIIPYGGLSTDVEAALSALESATRFDEIKGHYKTICAERDRRIPRFLAMVLPAALLGAGLVFIAQVTGWLPAQAPWAYAFGPILFAAIVMSQLRPNAARDDNRIGKALRKWRTDASEQTPLAPP